MTCIFLIALKTRSNYFKWFTINLGSAFQSYTIYQLSMHKNTSLNILRNVHVISLIERQMIFQNWSRCRPWADRNTNISPQLLSWGPLHLPTTDHMDVEVIDALCSISAIINHHAKSYIFECYWYDVDFIIQANSWLHLYILFTYVINFSVLIVRFYLSKECPKGLFKRVWILLLKCNKNACLKVPPGCSPSAFATDCAVYSRCP